MLHRAASNAYSWWWASHIRTKQSKWLDNNLQEVEVKVENMLKLIEEDGDSFAQKAEMYYRKRPELIKFVEEFYRAYRALAERYDHISGELHKANKTLATVFPDQVQLSISDGEETTADKTLAAVFPDGDDDEEGNRSSSAMVPPFLSPPMETPPLETSSKQFAGLSRESAQQEIDKLLKGILIFQTEKEFIKSCYESNLGKYWEIERKMTEMQKEVCLLQDHYSVSMAIEDDEARALMAATALKTCEAALVNLQEQQKQSMEEASLASERIRVSRGKLNSLKMAAIQEEISLDLERDLEDSSFSETKFLSLAMAEERLELQTMCEKIKEHFEKASVEELAEKIDELADKIIGLEVKASSQTAQIRRLRNEADELQKNLQRIEDEKMDLAAALGSYGKLRDMEEELLQLQFLESSVKDESQKLLSDFSMACRSFVDLSERFHSGDGGCSPDQEHLKEEEEDVNEALRSIFDPDYAGISENFQSGDRSSSPEHHRRGRDSIDESSSIHGDQDEEDEDEEDEDEEEEEEEEEERENGIDRSVKIQLGDGGFSSQMEDSWGTEIFSSGHGEELQSQNLDEEDEVGSLNWQQMLMSGLEDREKLLLNEYTSILRNYKETKRRLFEIEKRHQQHLSETMAKIRELKHANAAKDEEILSLRSKLQSLECPKSPVKEERESSPAAIPAPEKEEESPEEGVFPAKEIDLQVPEEPESSNAIEERFRRDIDGLLEENLEFWLRFSASFQQIQKLQASWKSLQGEILQVGGGGASSSDTSPDSLFKNLGKLQSELLSWLDENTQLKSELQLRFSSLGKIKEEMSRVLAESAGEEESQLTAYRATKFHGELLSMQQENNKVAEDLRAGLGTAKSVQAEVERAMARLRRSLGVVSPAKTQPHYHFRHFSGKSRVPLKSILLFGAKPKPKKPSLFSCMNPALQKQYSDLSPGLRPRN